MRQAWLCLVLGTMACGDDGSQISDETECLCAPMRDASIDGGPPRRPFDAAQLTDARTVRPDSEAPFAPECTVILSLDSAGQNTLVVSSALDAGTTPLSLWAENRSTTEQTVFVDGCRGPTLTGLGEYDPQASCLVGACAPNRPPREYTLAPGHRISLSMPELEVRATPCDLDPLAPGDYALTFLLNAPQTSAVCGPRPLSLQVR
jgi:hypothetical protein